MSRAEFPGPPVLWTEADSARLERDIEEVEVFAPGLKFIHGPGDDPDRPHHGVWHGRLPVWPMDRPIPEGLSELVPEGLAVFVSYPAAYPMLPVTIYPVDPEPELAERSQHTWHVAPDGRLCLLQTLGAWDPSWSLTELLRRASGWRVEYALLKAGVADSMTLTSIVDDDSRDHLIAQAGAAFRQREDDDGLGSA